MKLILKLMMKLSQGLLGARLHFAYLMALSLSACAGLKPFPEKKLYEFDPKEPICAEYEITDIENLQYKWVKDIPFKQCPPIFGFTQKQIPNVLNWTRDAARYAKERCQ